MSGTTSSGGRSWCPAIAAADCLTSLNARGQSPPRRRGEGAKLKGASAGEISSHVSRGGHEVDARVLRSSKFSARVAISAASSRAAVDSVLNAPFDVIGLARPSAPATTLPPVHFPSAAALQKAAAGLPRPLQSVSLAGIDTTTQALQDALAALPQLPRRLDISNAMHSTGGVEALAKILRKTGGGAVEDLVLRGNAPGLGGAPNDEPNARGAEELAKYIAETQTLKSADLSECNLGTVGAALCTTGIAPNASVTSLNLSRNAFGKVDESVAALAQVLQENKFIEEIQLSENEFSAAQAKQLIDAIAQSDTRVPTPPPEPEPEPEEYTDELPPEDEPPQQPIGFPEDLKKLELEKEKLEQEKEKEKEKMEKGEDDPAAEEAKQEEAHEAGEAEPPQEEAAKDEATPPAEENEVPPAADNAEKADEEANAEEAANAEEGEEAEEQEGAAEAEKEGAAQPEASEEKKPPSELDDGDFMVEEHEEATEEKEEGEQGEPPVDDEMAAKKKRRLERRAAKRAEYEAAKAAWTERHEMYIWGPQRVHAEYAEYKARRAVMQEHIAETTQLKAEEKKDRLACKAAQLAREKLSRVRRSGWTHLKSLSLQENNIGKDGAKAVAAMLRHFIPLTTEEIDAKLQKLKDEQEERLQKARQEKERLAEEKRNLEEQAKQQQQQEQQEQQEGEEKAADAPPPTEAPENSEEQPEPAAPEIALKMEEKRKPGVQSITSLDLSCCNVGPSGLKHIASTIKDNAPSLRALALRKNKFGVKRVGVAPEGEEEAEGNEKTAKRVEVPDWVSPGVEALASAVAENRSLTALDLSYNSMYPVNLALLVAGLRTNNSIQALIVDGNGWGMTHPITGTPAVEDLLMALSGEKHAALHTLSLAASSIGPDALTAKAAAALSALSGLTALNLSSNPLQSAGIAALGAAFAANPQSRPQLRVLQLQSCEVVGASGGLSLQRLLSCLPKLQTLALHRNALGADGMKEVLAALPTCSTLANLFIVQCGITSGDELAAVLPQLPFLRVLDAGDNEMDPVGATKCVSMLGSCPQLRHFALWARTVDLEAHIAPVLFEIVRRSPQLCHVNLGAHVTTSSSGAVDGENEEEGDIGAAIDNQCYVNALKLSEQAL